MTWLFLNVTQYMCFIEILNRFCKIVGFLSLFGQFDGQIFAILVVPIKNPKESTWTIFDHFILRSGINGGKNAP